MKRDEQLCMSSGMDGYLCKPIRPQELDAVLNRIESVRSEESSRAPAAPLDPVVG
jgi:DNA-binding response OmpR family regulator